jgi:hypothetical protein
MERTFAAMSAPSNDSALEQLQRWERAGAIWRVVARSGSSADVALLTCSGGEVVSVLHIDEPAALAFLGGRGGSDS